MSYTFSQIFTLFHLSYTIFFTFFYIAFLVCSTWMPSSQRIHPRPGAPLSLPEGVASAPDLPTLLRHSEVLSLHCPYTPATHHVIDAAALALMPAGSWLVNTARGGLIDEAARHAALDNGHIAGAALDVFETEPPPAGYALRTHPRVLATPHVSGVTDGSLVNMGLMAAECIAAHLTGQPVPAERIVVGGR